MVILYISRKKFPHSIFFINVIMLDEAILKIMATREKSKVKPLKKIFQGTHKMANGTVMSGAKHTKKSKVVKGAKKRKKGGY